MPIRISLTESFYLTSRVILLRSAEQIQILSPEGKGWGLGIKDVVLDTGSYTTVLPKSVSEPLGFDPRKATYRKGGGVGSVIVLQHETHETSISIGIEGKDEDGTARIAWGQAWPEIYITSILGIAAGIRNPKFDDHDFEWKEAEHYFRPKIQKPSDYRWIVESPQECPDWNSGKRAKLEQHGASELNYMLIGLDWMQSMKRMVSGKECVDHLGRRYIEVKPDPEIEEAARLIFSL